MVLGAGQGQEISVSATKRRQTKQLEPLLSRNRSANRLHIAFVQPYSKLTS
jgi:hypothetical protein